MELRRRSSPRSCYKACSIWDLCPVQNLFGPSAWTTNSLFDVEFTVDSESEVEIAYLYTATELRRSSSPRSCYKACSIWDLYPGQNLFGHSAWTANSLSDVEFNVDSASEFAIAYLYTATE